MYMNKMACVLYQLHVDFEKSTRFSTSLVKLTDLSKLGCLIMHLILNTTDLVLILLMNTHSILDTTFALKMSNS